MTSQKEVIDKDNPSFSAETETEVEAEEMAEQQEPQNEGDFEGGESEIKGNLKPIRELSPQEKRRKALYQKTRLLTYGDFVKILKGESWIIETSLTDSGHAERQKYNSKDMEWKYVSQALIPHLDETKKHELRFTPKQGEDLQKLLELGYTKIRVSRNMGDGKDTKFTFEGLE